MRNIIKLALAGLLSVSTFAVAAESSPEALRIGYQKGSIGMVLAKSHQLLEKRYPESKISWVEFPAGPQMLEALNVGSIDLGSTGDIPPIFAQAAGAGLSGRGAFCVEPQPLTASSNITLQLAVFKKCMVQCLSSGAVYVVTVSQHFAADPGRFAQAGDFGLSGGQRLSGVVALIHEAVKQQTHRRARQ